MKFTIKNLKQWLGLDDSPEELEIVDKYSKPEDADETDSTVDSFHEYLIAEPNEPPFEMTYILVNRTLTVFILETGEEIVNNNATREMYEAIKLCKSRGDVMDLLVPRVEIKDKETVAAKKMHNNKIETILETLKSSKDFEVKEESAYLKGINRSMPKLLVAKFAKLLTEKNINALTKIENTEEGVEISDEYQALKNFWLWCVANPKPQVADLLFNFLDKNGLRLNKQGFFYALRNVVTVSENEHKDNDLIEAITNSYVKIKAWKKGPANFSIYKENKEYLLCKNTSIPSLSTEAVVVGNLADLYTNIGENLANRYTDAHTKTFDIRIGVPVTMDPSLCSWTTVDCGESGLHFTMNEINYVGCGDTSVLVLINPMKVVGIGDTKGRCYEYLPIMAVNRSEVTKILRDKDFNTLELDEWYAVEELKGLEEKVKTSFVEEAKKHTYKKSIDEAELKPIIASLLTIKDTIKDRVVAA